MSQIYLFYADRLYGEYTSTKQIKPDLVGTEVYNGGYVYVVNVLGCEYRTWYRCDFTPMLIEDVPKTLQALLLLLL